jgi:hypothetical protein
VFLLSLLVIAAAKDSDARQVRREPLRTYELCRKVGSKRDFSISLANVLGLGEFGIVIIRFVLPRETS